ncbi:LemA protein [Candidatus Kryptobacter tengchongensis]|uniref:LemA protein n=1 Tax=Kryptobacter tengchongensis TaxID=1643429 RepID=A0A656D2J2_KRYT1|nr:LemA family protein [Candidatus Kryptobacter tengchongensis]CUS96989.1 LemA protein [Candidatus Kryptobacter tengchongensis]CUS97855.1 LemA protein [Candidatus Kryptobacter tengchongensis]CUU03406.1 LemA protein [Candidatus Kryptobacter tengchongensis]
MSKTLIAVLGVVGFLLVAALLIVGWITSTYNQLVQLDEMTNQAWAQVENQYQRRYDLIPNLVETVKGYAKHEREVFIQVTEARARVGQINITPEVLKDPQAFEKFQQAQDALGSALSRLLAVAENYPQLKANENFLQLQAQLEGTENRISVERRRYNEVVQKYNTYIRRFPTNIIAGMFGFKERPYFKAAEQAQQAPKVQF